MSKSGYVKIQEDKEIKRVDENGEVHHSTESSTLNKRISYGRSEVPYFRTYTEYTDYLDDMPRSHTNLIRKLFRYNLVSPAKDGMLVHLDLGTKKFLMKQMGLQDLQSLNNILNHLNNGNCLIKLSTGLYQVNPWIWGLGTWGDVEELRANTIRPDGYQTYGEVIKKHKVSTSGEGK